MDTFSDINTILSQSKRSMADTPDYLFSMSGAATLLSTTQ
jgi:hypothetical protein